jgi:hypothetical protein
MDNPVVATVAVLVLIVGALTATELLPPSPRAASVAPTATATMPAPSTAAPTSSSLPQQDPAAEEACRRLVANSDASDFPLMMDIGSAAAQSLDNSIRINGNLLHNTAQTAAVNKAHGATPQEQIKDRTELTVAAAALLSACHRSGFVLT